MSPPSPVDLAHLSRYTGGDKSLNAEVLSLFAKQSGELLDQLAQALRLGDAKIWRDITHSLKGGARGIGAFDLADTAAQAEDANPARDQGEASRALGNIKARTLAVTAFIDTYLAL